MIQPLLLSSFAAGVIATSLMVFALYLPRLWQGRTYDMVGAIGAAIVGRESQRSRFMGWTVYFLAGLFFAAAYGWLVMIYSEAAPPWLPQWQPELNWPVAVDLFLPLLGAVAGLAHGTLAAYGLAAYLADNHPVEQYRDLTGLVPTQLFSHMVFGAVVTFFQHQFLQLLVAAT